MTIDQANQQAQKAWVSLSEGDFEAAIRYASELTQAGYEVGYRIRSAIAEEQEDWDEAENIINEGLTAHPDAWPLHLQLGTLYTQSGRFEEAITVFEKALELPEVEKHWIEMNQAVAFSQLGKVDEALNLLQGIKHEELRNQAFEIKMQLLDTYQRHDLMLELVADELEDLVPPQNEEEAAVMSRVLALIANACYYEDKDEKETRFYLKQAINYDRSNELSLMVLREMRAEFTEQGKLYGILIQANIKSTEGLSPIMTTYGILADSVDEALSMIHEFEIESLDRDSIQIMEVEESAPDEEEELKGIYLVGGLGFLN
ncbi:MAG: tetratricopeptide repeat protein [Bacteroidota bacterium]